MGQSQTINSIDSIETFNHSINHCSFHSEDLNSNSPYCRLYDSYGVNLENLLLDRLKIPLIPSPQLSA